MNTEFDIENLKREMPYRVPESFFENITEKTLNEISRRKKKTRTARWVLATGSVAASFLLLFFIATSPSTDKIGGTAFAFDKALQQICDEYSTEVHEIFLSENETFIHSENEINKFISEISDEDFNDIFLNAESDIFYAEL